MMSISYEFRETIVYRITAERMNWCDVEQTHEFLVLLWICKLVIDNLVTDSANCKWAASDTAKTTQKI